MQYILLFEDPIQDKFIKDYLSFLQNKKFSRTSLLSGPNQNSSTTEKIVQKLAFSNQIQQNINGGFRPVIFLNSEYGCLNTKLELEKLKSEYKFDFDLFIFPNNQNDGTIINLFENIVNNEHGQILNCIEQYFSCVESLQNSSYCLPAPNAKMISYIEILKNISGTHNVHLRNVNFNQIELWNLNSQYLDPLKNFIDSLV